MVTAAVLPSKSGSTTGFSLAFCVTSLDLLKMILWIIWFLKALLDIPASPSPILRWPVLICLGLRDFLGFRTFDAETRTMLGNLRDGWSPWALPWPPSLLSSPAPRHHHCHHYHHHYPHRHRHYHITIRVIFICNLSDSYCVQMFYVHVLITSCNAIRQELILKNSGLGTWQSWVQVPVLSLNHLQTSASHLPSLSVFLFFFILSNCLSFLIYLCL